MFLQMEKMSGMFIGSCMWINQELFIFFGCGVKFGMWKLIMIYVMFVFLMEVEFGIRLMDRSMSFLFVWVMLNMFVVFFRMLN